MPVNQLFSRVIRMRMREITNSLSNPHETQEQVFNHLVSNLTQTSFGYEHGITKSNSRISLEEFKKRIPIRSYDQFKPWIQKAESGELDVIWPGEIKWFAKSSGTTSDKSKHLPITAEFLKQGHYKGGRDLLSIYCNQVPKAPLYSGKHLIIGGSTALNENIQGSYVGDLSAIIVRNLPPWVEMRRTPNREITLHEDWNVKVKLMAESVAKEDVRILAGVPSWMLVVCKEVLKVTGAESLDEVWPNLWLYMHGGVGFEPYRKEFAKLIKSPSLSYMETYNASEGFFGLQDELGRDDMALLLNHGVFYEFIPLEEYNEESLATVKTMQLEELEVGADYAMVVSTSAGLWRYNLGDVVRVTSTDPYRIKVVGRTSNFINVVGEELMVAQTEKALSTVAAKHGVSVREFTVAPRFDKSSGAPLGHHWLIELQEDVDVDSERFSSDLDSALCELNSDYEAKRTGDFILDCLSVDFISSGSFDKWLKSKDKLGGQHKVPRLSNSRKVLEEILFITN